MTGQNTPIWGVFDASGNPVAVYDTFIATGARSQRTSTQAPIEGGSFSSYNKVTSPRVNHVTLACGGTLMTRTQFLQAIDAACASLNLYTILIPELSYTNCSLESWDFRRVRDEGGATMIVIDLAFSQIRQTQAQYTKATKTPAGTAQYNGGKVQAATPTASQSSALADATDEIKSYLAGVTGQ